MAQGLRWLRMLGAAVLAVAALPSGSAVADGGEIRFVCAYPAGSGADAIVRFFAEKLRSRFDRPLIVDNRPGGVTMIATEYVARAKPDGRTIFVHGGTGLAANMNLFTHPAVDAAKAFQVVATLNRQVTMLAVGARRPWHSLAELTAAMKAKGANATYGTSNTTAKAVAGIYKQVAGLPDAVEVPYKTSNDTRNDLISGALDYLSTDPVFALREASAGTLRVLGISSAARIALLPELPTMTEQGVPMDLVAWWGVMVPAATPRALVDQLNAWFNEVVLSDDSKRFFNNFGSEPWASTPDDGQAVLLREIREWADIVRIANIEKLG